MSDPLHDSVRRLIARTGMIPPGSGVVVAVSGGQDSCALLHALAALRDELRVRLHAAHLNHGFRGEESAADAAFVQEFSESLDVPFTVERQDVPGAARRLHLSAQEAARRARHRFLERVAGEVGADRIALGHTRDDRVETILLNILRGTGLEGLKGPAPVAGRRIRPLLEVSRAETAEYCRRHGIAFRQDASNLSPAYTRNRIRMELLPHLASYYNPEVRDALLRLSDLVFEETAYMEERAREALERACMGEEPDRILLSTQMLLEMPVAMLRRVLRLAIDRVRGSLEDIEFADVGRILKALRELRDNERRFQFTLPPGNIYVSGNAQQVSVRRRRAASALPVKAALTVPGETAVPEWKAVFRAQWRETPQSPVTAPGAPMAYMDANALRLPLIVRTQRPGDRFQPLGMTGTRKLQDYFTDKKVPVEARDRTPLVADAEGIVWIVGHAVGERVRVRPETRRVLFLEMTTD
jgi:tRNA(Ile)-lysidine synthase